MVVTLTTVCPKTFAQGVGSTPNVDLAFCDRIDVANSQALVDACRFALSLRHILPNVICDQSTYRDIRSDMIDAIGEERQDRITAHVIYEDGHERYSDISINGKPLKANSTRLTGQFTAGEYGTDLIFAFTPENLPSYRFLRREHVHSHHAFVYEVEVAQKNNHSWGMQGNDKKTFPEFVARIWLDQNSHQILRFEVTPVPDKTFPISDVHVRTDYERLPLGDGTSFDLPVNSESSSCLWDNRKKNIIFCSTNTLEFKNCHKFSSKSRILTDLNSTVK